MSDSKGILFEPSRDPLAPRGKNFLLVIGINEYQYVAKLQNAVRDARSIVRVLTDQYQFEQDGVVELYDAEATELNIKKAFRSLGEKIRPGVDSLITFYSGHGHYDQFLDEGYWVPVNAQFAEEIGYISYSYINKIIKAIPTHHTLFIVDSCYSGVMLVRDIAEATDRLEKDPSRWIIASGRNEVVADGNIGGNSPFTEQLIHTLTRNVQEGIRVSELVNKVTTAVVYNSPQTPIGRPIFGVGDEGGEFIFHPKFNEERDWTSIQQHPEEELYRQFIARYPKGKHVEEASWSLATLIGTSAAYDDYLEQCPGGPHVSEAKARMFSFEDEAKWAKVVDSNSIFEYREYLDQFGDHGAHAAEAREKMKQLKHGGSPKEPAEMPVEENITRQFESMPNPPPGSAPLSSGSRRIQIKRLVLAALLLIVAMSGLLFLWKKSGVFAPGSLQVSVSGTGDQQKIEVENGKAPYSYLIYGQDSVVVGSGQTDTSVLIHVLNIPSGDYFLSIKDTKGLKGTIPFSMQVRSPGSGFLVTGYVRDEHHNPLSKVNILPRGSVSTTISNADGRFDLFIKGTAGILNCQLDGFKIAQQDVIGGMDTLNIVMYPSDGVLKNDTMLSLNARDSLQKIHFIIHGRVVDESDQPISSVVVKSKTVKSISTSNYDGMYAIGATVSQDTLIFSSSNYSTGYYRINPSIGTLNIILKKSPPPAPPPPGDKPGKKK